MLGSTIVMTIPFLINIHQVYAIYMPFAVMDGLISLIPNPPLWSQLRVDEKYALKPLQKLQIAWLNGLIPYVFAHNSFGTSQFPGHDASNMFKPQEKTDYKWLQGMNMY